jgi:cell division protein FtsQ
MFKSLKKINWKNVLRITAISIVCVSFMVLAGFVSKDKSNLQSKGVRINIEDEQDRNFVDRNDIIQLLNAKSKKVKGTRMAEINTAMLENIINTNPYIKQAEVYSTIDGWVQIDVKQRTPVLRVINANQESFYVDNTGSFMPLSEKYTEPVIVVNGFLFDTYVQQKVRDSSAYIHGDSISKLKAIDQAFYLANFINADTLYNALIEQIYITSQQEIELVPRVGNHIIILGDISNLAEKMNKLKVFYQKGLNEAGWDQYATVNLKYKNQVVCTKRKTTNLN